MTRGKHIWLVPLCLALLVGGAGWWADRQLRRTIQAELRGDLQSTLDANVTALEIWMENQKRIAAGLAEEPRFLPLPRIAGASDGGATNRAAMAAFHVSDYRAPEAAQFGYHSGSIGNRPHRPRRWGGIRRGWGACL
jgi:hypothetical protein